MVFDPAACLAMLRAFYPEASPGALARARQERPEYFAGGEIIGNKGDALRMPDGEIWDLIYSALDPTRRRWQMIRPGAGGADVDDPFALEEGPLTWLEPDRFPRPQFERTFETLVAGGARQLAGSDQAAGGHVATIAAAASPVGLDAAYEHTVGAAGRETGAQLASWHVVDPSDVLASAGELEGVTYIREEGIANPAAAPGDAPDVNPGPAPRDEGEPGDRAPEV